MLKWSRCWIHLIEFLSFILRMKWNGCRRFEILNQINLFYPIILIKRVQVELIIVCIFRISFSLFDVGMFVVWFWNRISCPFHLTERSWWTFSLIHCSPFSCCIPCRYWRTPWWFCCPCSPCRFCCDYASWVFFIILIDTIWSCGSKSKSGCWGTGVFLLGDSKIFILIRCDITHMQLWRHNEGTNDKKFNLILHEDLQCA